MKKKIFVVLCLMMILMLCPLGAMAEERVPELTADAYILLDSYSGEILAEENSREKRYPASVTKMMTLLLAVEAVEDGKIALEDIVKVSPKAAATGGSTMHLEPAEEISFNDLLYGLALVSGNDASIAVAETIGGSVEGFAEMMNDRAVQLGMVDTHFVNPNGLRDKEHYTTAYDLAILAKECVQHPLFLKICGKKEYVIRLDESKPTVLENTNGLLGEYNGMDGIKTGWIGTDSGYCLASTASRDDVRLISILLGAKTREISFDESEQLLDYGFSQCVLTQLLTENETVATLKVRDGQQRKVNVGSNTTISCLVDDSHVEGMEIKYSLERELIAPLQAGEVVGTLQVVNTYKDKVVESYDLVILEDVAEGNFIQKIVNRFLNFF